MTQWEYRVIHINFEKNTTEQQPDPEVASEKLGGTLSPEFLAREFPKQYSPETAAKSPPKHPAVQLQDFLNLMGKEGWELVETSPVGPLLMFFFKRPLRDSGQPPLRATPAARTNALDAETALADHTARPNSGMTGTT